MADQASQPNSANSQPNPAPRKSSGCAKALVIVGALTFLMLLVCAGVVGGLAWSIWPTIISNPVEVAAVGKQILDVDVPPEFEAMTGFKMDNFAMSMQMAAYRRKDEKGSLVLGAFRMKLENVMQKPEFQSKSGKDLHLKLSDTKVVDFKVREQSVPFRFSNAVDQDSQKKFRVVEAEFESNGESKFFKLVLEDEVYDEAATIQLIESIR